MKAEIIEYLIHLTGEEHDSDIVTYGFEALLDGLKTICVVMVLGFVSHYYQESMIYLLFSFVGTSTLGGGITLKLESVALYGRFLCGR